MRQKKSQIFLKNVRVHNLQGIDLILPTHELIVFTGVSGSGKSSLAFDTLFVEGQRRYIESLSTFARRYLGDMAKPDMEYAEGLSPTISIEQKSASPNPRSTVGTMTEIYDYLRVLFARVATPHCPVSGEAVLPQSKERIIKKIQGLGEKTRLIFLSPLIKAKKGEFKEEFQSLLRKGFTKARVDGHLVDLSEPIELEKNIPHTIDLVIDRLLVTKENHSRIAEAVLAALEQGNGLMSVLDVESNEETLFSMQAYSPKSGLSYGPLEPHDFSFNSPTGMCPTCSGLGETQEFDLDKIIDPDKSISADCCSLASSFKTVRYGNIYRNLAEIYDFDLYIPWKELPEKAKEVFLYGSEKKWLRMHFIHPERAISWTDTIHWGGVLEEARRRYMEAKSASYRKKMEALQKRQVCPTCKGSRLRPYPAAALLGGYKIHELTHLDIQSLLHFFQKELVLDAQERLIAEELLKEIERRLFFLTDVGLHYLALERTAPTLSGGEAQRVRLASQVGCGLVGVTYVLDEPSIGLHPRDNKKLIATLKSLRNAGNTVVVVEHDEETIWEADRVVDFGPGAGVKGGRILVNGSHKELLSHPESLTGAYLSGKKRIPLPEKRRNFSESITIYGAEHHNLKKIDASFPLGCFVAVTGVSGSGKSSLVSDTLFCALANHLHHADHPVGKHKKIKGIEKINKVIAIDQSPIGRTPRSNPATYVKLFDDIRSLFSSLPESIARGFSAGRFSFNVRDGSCTRCLGLGMVRIDMDFLEDEWVICQNCQAKRFDYETLSILYKGKNIHDVLEMSVADARDFFAAIPSLKRKLDILAKVGMDYIKLGQSSTTLSGGEAQRIKLAKELARPQTGKTFYILDEPTTGLHFQDVFDLLKVLHELVDLGNTVLVIEHNMDVVKTADWVIDLGPEGGAGGGQITAAATPEGIAALDSPTGAALKSVLFPTKRKIKTKKETRGAPLAAIRVEGAEQNNLKHLDLSIPRGKMTICTGPSGSGKSSLAFDTVYAEGQRRYIDSLSPYARQFVRTCPKPKLGQIEGLSPAIAIEQKATAGNPRSTVGTLTEIYDYLRLLFAHAGTAYCPDTGEPIQSITKEYVAEQLLSYPSGEKLILLSPLELQKTEKFEELLAKLKKLGFLRIRLNGQFYEIEEPIPFDRKRKNEISLVIDRLKVDSASPKRLYEGVEQAALFGNNKVLALSEHEERLFNLSFAVATTGKSYPEITPHTFSFNKQEGMCPECMGLGVTYGANLAKNKEAMHLSTLGLLRGLWTQGPLPLFERLLKKKGFDLSVPLSALPEGQLKFLMSGSEEWIDTGRFSFRFLGIEPILAKAGRSAHSHIRDELLALLEEKECNFCSGSRLNPLARNVRLEGHSIASVCALSIKESVRFIEQLKIPSKKKKVLEEVIKQLSARLGFLQQIGLDYISLDRRAPTLSNGEAQRIRLARQLGSQLSGVLYVLDEPTIGLHPHDTDRLIKALNQLKELNNTLLMVEHDPQIIKEADYVLDFGPGAGDHGGHITAQGSYEEILGNPSSLTGAYLSGNKQVELGKKRRNHKGYFLIEKASCHNLKEITVEIPLKVMSCLIGVSGSGKSTLLHQEIKPRVEKLIEQRAPFDKLIIIDQNPIGHTVRSDVGSYSELFPVLRSFYASLALARVKGLQPGHFSFNHRKGMCSHCWGLGVKRVSLLFMPSVEVPCAMCKGLRLNPVSLEIAYENKNFGQLLEMTVTDARVHFSVLPKACRILDTLISVGLGYLKLGQEMVSLSGGEAQRIKLSRELAKRGSGKTLYLLDEPTTGLHPDDISKLLSLLHRLVDKGNTMVIIEHNLDVLKNADYLIELGPEAGAKGGYLISTGTPEELAKNPFSLTGKYLKC